MHKIDSQLQLMLDGRFDEAWRLSEEMQAIGPEDLLDARGNKNPEMWVRHSFNRGWFLLQQNRYKEGCQLLENGRFIKVYGSPPLKTTAPLYNPEEHDVKGKSIIISLEGGYGDEMIHARFATSFKNLGAENVYLAADPSLHSLLERIEGVTKCITRAESHTVHHDFWVPGFSAGWLSGHTFDDFPGKPYLTAKPESVEMWKTVFNTEKKKVGIRWAGNPKFEHQQFRKFPEKFMTQLKEYDGLQVYSLQRDNNIIDLPQGIIDLQHLLISWEDTAAAIMNLDLVITSCTSIAHLSAALGKETWVMVPILPYHTWTLNAPYSTTSPYYETARLFRQEKKGEWNVPFQKMYAALEKKFDLPHVDLPSQDKEVKRLNLGCGFKKIDGFNNVDASSICTPDEVVDLNSKSWPWKDNEYTHIVAKDILEHLGHSGVKFEDIIKEMYRVSDNGAVWEVQFPHWNCDIAKSDPEHVRLLTLDTFKLFDMKRCFDKAVAGETDSYHAFTHGVDIEIVDHALEFTHPVQAALEAGEIPEEQLEYMINHLNNVVLSVKVLIQVHKPGRHRRDELDRELRKAALGGSF